MEVQMTDQQRDDLTLVVERINTHLNNLLQAHTEHFQRLEPVLRRESVIELAGEPAIPTRTTKSPLREQLGRVEEVLDSLVISFRSTTSVLDLPIPKKDVAAYGPPFGGPCKGDGRSVDPHEGIREFFSK